MTRHQRQRVRMEPQQNQVLRRQVKASHVHVIIKQVRLDLHRHHSVRGHKVVGPRHLERVLLQGARQENICTMVHVKPVRLVNIVQEAQRKRRFVRVDIVQAGQVHQHVQHVQVIPRPAEHLLTIIMQLEIVK